MERRGCNFGRFGRERMWESTPAAVILLGSYPPSLFISSGLCVFVAALASTGCSGGERAAARQRQVHDSPRLVLNRSIGDIRLNTTRGDVERLYGKPTREKVLRDYYFPVGTRYHGKKLIQAVYRPHGGVLKVAYVGGDVKMIETTSARYRTASGISAGAHLPNDRCMRLDEIGHIGPRGCRNTWRGFNFDGECLDAWLTSTRAKAMTILYMQRGRRIETVRVGDPDVILPCF
jgi:hypothetical protein